MASPVSRSWFWEPTDPNRSGSSGDISKLFRNEPVKNPGAFARDKPSDTATLMVREVLQNSSDAARELRAELGAGAPEFEVLFDFASLDGEAKAHFVRALDLGALARQLDAVGGVSGRARLGLGQSDALDDLGADGELSVLRIEERGTTGMYGPFVGSKSKMYLAMVSLGYTVKGAGSGGSYGYGKAGLIRASRLRTVVAYSCFRERSDDPGVTRRLLGMTYWGQHDAAGDSFTGFARYGRARGDAVVPFENEEADEVAAQLGLARRSADDVSELGTTFLVVDPNVPAEDVVNAVERNWWPAIIGGELSVSVRTGSDEIVPRPRRQKLLQPFLEAFDLAMSAPDNLLPTTRRHKFSTIDDPAGRKVEPGALGLVADPEGWSYAPDTGDLDEVGECSLVALVRGPRMIVEYLPVGAVRPYVRGVFVASEDVDDLLRQTEPKAHDSWQERIDDDGVDPFAPKVASAVIARTKRSVNEFRRQLKPPPRPAEDLRLPELERLFRSLFSAKGGKDAPSPEHRERPVSLQMTQELIAMDDSLRVCAKGAVRVALFDRPKAPEEAEVEIVISYRYVEDGGVGQEADVVVEPPPGFDVVGDRPARIVGVLGRDYREFRFRTEPYPADWTGRLKAEATVLTERSAAEGSPQ